jgi:hypothetical protein
MQIRSVAVGFVICLIGPRASSQVKGGGVSGVVLSAGHELLGNPLVGAGGEFRIPVGDGRGGFRFGGERVVGQSRRIGVPCAGLVRPGTCSPEPIRDQSQLTTIRVGGTLRLFGGQRNAVSLAADWIGAGAHVVTRGQSSGNTLIADKVLWGPWIGADADWVPTVRIPIGLEIEAGIGSLAPVASDQILDGYTPFEGGFTVRHLRLALVWRPWVSSQR